MRIGLICPYNIARGGGVQEHILAQYEELSKRGHEVYIITPRPRDYDEISAKHILFVGSSTDLTPPMLQTTAQVSAGLNEDIDRVLETHQFDILHFHEPWVPMLSRQILSRSRSVNIGTFHAHVPETIAGKTFKRVVMPYTRSVLKYIHAYTAVSDAAAQYVCSLIDVPVAIVPNGIDLGQYKPPRSFPDRRNKTIFYIGRLEGRKGTRFLLHAFALLQKEHPNVSLIIASDGPDREKLENLASDLELKNVQFKGFISTAEKLKYLRTSDLFCAPALYGESFGIVLVEAMATGLVTVAGDNPGYKTVLTGLGSMSLVNPKHLDEFTRRLSLLLYEKDLRKLWRNWAQEEVQQYSYPNVVSLYEEVYAKALKAHPLPQDD